MYLYVPVDSGITTFDDEPDDDTTNSVITAINEGQITSVCSVGVPGGGGYETTCQNSMDLFLTTDGINITCTGYGGLSGGTDTFEEMFQQLDDGACQMVFGGVPPDQTGDNYNAIRMPAPWTPVSYFRQRDLSSAEGNGDDPNAVFRSSKTSLELAVSKSFNALIGDETWRDTFAGIAGIAGDEGGAS